MNKRLFLATTAAVAIATSAFAQSSPSTSSSTPSATQQQKDSTSTPSSSTSTPSNSSGSVQTTPSSNSAQSQSPSSTNQTAGSPPSNSGSGTNTTQAPSAGNSTNQAQTNQPSNPTTTPSNQAQTNSPSSTTQSANPPPSTNNQAQLPSGGGSTNTAQQPSNQQNTADRSSNTNVNASVNINDQQRTRISASISHLNVQPLTNVNFSLSVGTVVPRDIRLQPLPAEVVEIVPQYRGYNFVLVKDEIVIIEPSTYKIVTVLPYSGRSTAAAPAREQRKVTFSDRDRDVVRKHAKARPVEREKRVTTGSSVRTEIRTGERVPEGVEIEAFPEEVYRDAPTLREYRYINRDSRTYIVEPRERRIIEEID